MGEGKLLKDIKKAFSLGDGFTEMKSGHKARRRKCRILDESAKSASELDV